MARQIAFMMMFLAAGVGELEAQHDDDGLRLMTFNIRYGTAEDGPNSWPARRLLVRDAIADFAPDVLALQEALAFQLDDLRAALVGYRKLGQHRDGGSKSEFSGLYVREDRVRISQWGEFWLSPTPDSVGSRGWDAALPRMAVWVDIEAPKDGQVVRVYGTHFDHRGEVARLESSRLIARHAQDGPPAIVMGDFNAREDSEPIAVFLELGYRSAFRTIHPASELGTFNGFRNPSGWGRIDHILLDGRLEPHSAEIITKRVNGIWQSDHFAVTAVLNNR